MLRTIEKKYAAQVKVVFNAIRQVMPCLRKDNAEGFVSSGGMSETANKRSWNCERYRQVWP